MRAPTLTTIRIVRRPTTAPIVSLTLNRPERLNALSHLLLTELTKACRWLDAQPDVRVVVVRGAGRAFSSGFDLGDFADPTASPRDTAELGLTAVESLTALRALTIAAIHGHCIGGGLLLAAACDVRLAADDTLFAIPEVDLGIPLAWSGIPRLARELGPAVTKELVLTCRPFDAPEALALRFLNRVVPGAELFAAADALAAELAAKPALALRATKTQVNAVMEEIAGTRRNASDADTLLAATHDPECQAASRAYLAKRRT